MRFNGLTKGFFIFSPAFSNSVQHWLNVNLRIFTKTPDKSTC